jgi:membrane-bound lytic murein transglycosylase D
MLGLENFYFPMIEQALDKYGLPHELKYLSIVESALNPTALSRAGASGLWQFMLPTGKQYGLEINSLVDERRDPLKATYAACQYFTDLYAIYGDWTLVIAAYNCGPGNVNKAITRANRSTDYWSIYPYLPQETRMYVPLFIAVNYVMNYYAQHQLYPVETNLPAATDTITINQQIHFDQISAVLGIEKEYLRALNPQYKRDIIPGNSMPRTLKLPSMLAYAFIEKQEDIVKYKADEIFTNRTYVGDYTQNNNEKIVYKVKRGETLATVAGKYGVTMSNIRKWNGLKSNKVKPGRSLILYVDNGGYNLKPNREEKFNREEKPNRKENVGAKKTPEDTASLGKYKIKKGDTYYNIAKKYPGCSASDLMRINNTTNKALKVGQYIKVPKG